MPDPKVVPKPKKSDKNARKKANEPGDAKANDGELGAGAKQKGENESQGDFDGLLAVLSDAPSDVLEILHQTLDSASTKIGEFGQAVQKALKEIPKDKFKLDPGKVVEAGNPITANQAPPAKKKDQLKPGTIKAILAEAERQWKLGFSDKDKMKYAVGSSYLYTKVDKDFEWCGAFVARTYQAAGISNKIVEGLASTVKIQEMVKHVDKFSKNNTFYSSPKEARDNPGKGVHGLKAYHKKLGQKRKGIELLGPGMKANTKVDTITRLKVDPKNVTGSLSGADIMVGDIMIVGKGKAGAHVTLVRNLDWKGSKIGTYEGNASTPDSGGGEYTKMAKSARKEFEKIKKRYKVKAYQVDSEYLTQQAPILAAMVKKMEGFVETKDKSWKTKIRAWLKAQPGVDKQWYFLVRWGKHSSAGLKTIKGWQKRLTDKKLVQAVGDWEAEAELTGKKTEMTGLTKTRVGKLERKIKVGTKDKRGTRDIKGNKQKGKTLARPMRYFYRLAQRDFEPYHYISTADAKAATKAKAKEKS